MPVSTVLSSAPKIAHLKGDPHHGQHKKKLFCKWNKDYINANINEIRVLTAKDRNVCQNRARAARHKDNLCKSLEFKKKKKIKIFTCSL